MRHAIQPIRPAAIGLALALFRPVAALAAGSPYVTAQPESFTQPLEAYAQIQPVALLPVKTPAAGVLGRLPDLPGAAVKPGDLLASLEGPELRAAQARAAASIRSATARLEAAGKSLGIVRAQLTSHLSTQQQVSQAEADLADAAGALSSAEAERATAEAAASLRSPVAGTVLSVGAALGERVAAGDTVLTLQPAHGIWGTATFYEEDASSIRLGQAGRFQPADGAPAVDVKVVSLAPGEGTGGDVAVGFQASGPNPAWRSGEYGNLILVGAAARWVSVPTQALILDQGKWWVLVHGPHGDRPAEVVPGPARGWNTLLRSGLAPGTQIVAQNAYLDYHRGIASRYQPPD